MRLHRLTLEGFGPFRDRQEVDFDAFSDDGIFLIAGRTGAGKSSVLDGVCFGLYGAVPRYDGAEKRLRSDHCAPEDPTRVSVEFSAGERRWRVTRSPDYERPKRRGEGTTVVAAEAHLEEFADGAWIGRASGARNVGLELDEVLGLSQQQFLQVILLAQNRFARFLLAKNDERQKLLRRLFGTRTYEDYQEALEARRRDSERGLAAAEDGVALLIGEAERALATDELAPAGVAADAPTVDRLDAVELGRQRAAYRSETLARERDAADAAHARADAAHASAQALHERQRQRLRARAALAELERRAPRVDEDRATLRRALAAEGLRTAISAADRADSGVVEAVNRADAARAVFAEVADTADAGADDEARLAALVDDLTGRIAVWQDAHERERKLDQARQDEQRHRGSAGELERALADLAATVAEVPARIQSLDDECDALRGPAAAVEERGSTKRDLDSRLAAATDALAHAEAARETDEAYLAAAAVLDADRAAVNSLLRQRLTGYAGELAHDLADGEPCPVCGAVDHPRPAPRGDAPVTDEQIVEAERRRDASAEAETAASSRARSAREAVAAAVARAGDATRDELLERCERAAAALQQALDAAGRIDLLAAERAELAGLARSADRERERVSAELATAREGLSAARARVESEQRAVDEARGGFASVRERIEDAQRRRDAAAALAAALAHQATARAASDQAGAELAVRVAESDFADAAAATAALRDAAERTRLDDVVREFDAALRAERDRVRELELELAGEPDEPIDLTATREALASARDAWTRGVDAAAHAAQTAAAVADLLRRATTAHGEIAERAADHDALARLANTVAGRAPNTHRMTLESFVLAAELEEIVEAANVRLEDMSAGRYRIQHTDALAARGAASGLGLEIMDAHTGYARPAQSLSGGETFLASLALALGLAEVVTARAGGVRLDTLFIDEGFGSLDDQTLDLAMRTLDELRAGGRTVGLISHVAAMKEQLPAQLLVEATPEGPSVIRHAVTTAP